MISSAQWSPRPTLRCSRRIIGSTMSLPRNRAISSGEPCSSTRATLRCSVMRTIRVMIRMMIPTRSTGSASGWSRSSIMLFRLTSPYCGAAHARLRSSTFQVLFHLRFVAASYCGCKIDVNPLKLFKRRRICCFGERTHFTELLIVSSFCFWL